MRAFRSNPDIELVAVCGRSAERTRLVAERFGVRYYLSVEDLIRSEALEIASVATGELDHFAASAALIEAGVPVLIEKSLTFRLDEARTLVSMARARNARCGVNFNMRYLMPFQLMRQAFDAGDIGRPSSFVWKFSHRWPPPAVGHDLAVAIIHHIHGLDLLLTLGGLVDTVAAQAAPGHDSSQRTTIGAILGFHSRAIGIAHGGVDGTLSNDVMVLECEGSLGRATARDATAESGARPIAPSFTRRHVRRLVPGAV
jgi:predicted dehydrogenase